MAKVCHIIAGLEDGGAEAVLYRLCKSDQSLKHIVISLSSEGKYGPLLKNSGFEVHVLGMPAGRLKLRSLWALWKLLRSIRPDIVQTWMYHADLIGGLMAKLAGIENIFWGLHHTNLGFGNIKLTTKIIAHLNGVLSKIIPRKIICCALASKRVHQRLGYDANRLIVISNGYDTSLFKNSDQAELKTALALNTTDLTLGMVARFDPQKDPLSLLEAVSIIKKKEVSVKSLFVGSKMNLSNSCLKTKIFAMGLMSEIILLDRRDDVPQIMNAIDLHVLSSWGEAFPNVIAEAMACGTPCVTTDVGDASLIVGETGWVVPPGRPDALAEAILCAFDEKKNQPEKWAKRKELARQRIVENFSLERMIKDYHQAWDLI